MAINNFNAGKQKENSKLLRWVAVCILFAAWILSPPEDKIAQLSYIGHNVTNTIVKVFNNNPDKAYKFHLENAIYLARMNKESALAEADKAVNIAPKKLNKSEFEHLYRERAKIRVWFKDYSGALEDYQKVSTLINEDLVRVALLYKIAKNRPLALEYCNVVLSSDFASHDGFACVADIYADAGKYDSSVKVLDALIMRAPEQAEYYIERAYYKKLAGDVQGEKKDIEKAKSLNPSVSLEITPITNILLPKNIRLSK